MTRLVDTNVFIHFLACPDDDVGRPEHDACRDLIDRVTRGEERLVTTEACIAEIFYVLTSKRRFGLPVNQVVASVRGIVSQRGIEVRPRGLYREALDVLDTHPRLDIEDAILVAHAVDTGMAILSYDRGFDGVAGITRQEPEFPSAR